MTEILLIVVAVLAVVLAALVAFDRLLPEASARAALGIERRLAGLTVARASADGFEFSYSRGGHGEPLVLLHGFGADKDNFVRVARKLKRRFSIIAVDLPGFGDSDRLMDASYKFAVQADRLKSMLDALGLDRYHMGGSSMGGAIAMCYAARYPEAVRSLWLLAPAGVDGAKDSKMAAEFRATGRSLLVVNKPQDFGALLDLTMEKKPFLPYSVKHVLGKRAATDGKLHSRIFNEIAMPQGVLDEARAIEAPVLIVWGTEDNVLDISSAAILDEALPNSTLVILDGIGHLPMMEVPNRVADDFKRFAEKIA